MTHDHDRRPRQIPPWVCEAAATAASSPPGSARGTRAEIKVRPRHSPVGTDVLASREPATAAADAGLLVRLGPADHPLWRMPRAAFPRSNDRHGARAAALSGVTGN